MLQQMHLTNVSENIEAKYSVLRLNFDVYKREHELWKLLTPNRGDRTAEKRISAVSYW